MSVDFDKYVEFVDSVTSEHSKKPSKFMDLVQGYDQYGNLQLNRLLTAAIGISAEGGEFAEIVKKIAFQGKPYNDANREHMIVELGDVMWYISQACISLGVSFEEIVQRNFDKLSARYPEGTFSIERSENRREGDI